MFDKAGFLRADLAADQDVFGAKVAVICDSRLIAYQRDDFSEIPNPNQWDLPGGERESGETALECVLRETEEEFGIVVPEPAFCHAARFEKFQPHRIEGVFFVAEVAPDLIDQIVFGDEGQRWRMMHIWEFITHGNAVAVLQRMTARWWRSRICDLG